MPDSAPLCGHLPQPVSRTFFWWFRSILDLFFMKIWTFLVDFETIFRQKKSRFCDKRSGKVGPQKMAEKIGVISDLLRNRGFWLSRFRHFFWRNFKKKFEFSSKKSEKRGAALRGLTGGSSARPRLGRSSASPWMGTEFGVDLGPIAPAFEEKPGSQGPSGALFSAADSTVSGRIPILPPESFFPVPFRHFFLSRFSRRRHHRCQIEAAHLALRS